MNKELEWKKSNCILEKTDFDKIEKFKRITLPDDFKSLIGSLNGSKLKNGYINHKKLGEIAYSGNISLLCTSKVNVWSINEMLFKDKNIIPFGDVGNGDYICLNLNDGYVYLWEHETDVFHYICKNFTELFEAINQE